MTLKKIIPSIITGILLTVSPVFADVEYRVSVDPSTGGIVVDSEDQDKSATVVIKKDHKIYYVDVVEKKDGKWQMKTQLPLEKEEYDMYIQDTANITFASKITIDPDSSKGGSSKGSSLKAVASKEEALTLPDKNEESKMGEKPYNHKESFYKGVSKLAKYKDLPSIEPWAYESMAIAVEKGFIEGNNEKLYPDATITRAEFLKIISSVIVLKTDAPGKLNFDDVKPEDLYYKYISKWYHLELVQVSDDRHFNPNASITRKEMATILSRICHLDIKEEVAPSDLEKVSPWAQKGVKQMVANGLITGCDNFFIPNDVVTREMAIVVAVRYYELDQVKHMTSISKEMDIK